MRQNNYDRIAWCYDLIGKLVFGDKLNESASHHLDQIQGGQSVLILGGGSGAILDSMPKGVLITYVDLSAAMIKKAKSRAKANQKIQFVHADFLELDSMLEFDVIICPYFLDLFDDKRLEQVLVKIHAHLTNKGRLIVTDFHQKKGHFSILTKVMYLFFRLSTNIQAPSLLPIKAYLSKAHFRAVRQKNWMSGYIFSNIYEK